MTKKYTLMLFAFLFFVLIARGQSKMITGTKHVIFVDIPKNWVQAPNDQLPFFIKPDEKDISGRTYMYVYGFDYASAPDLNGWIKGDNDDMAAKHPGLKIDSLAIDVNNIKKGDYETGRYKIITYAYTDNHKEAILVIECKNTIATVVLSANTTSEFEKYLPAFKELIQTIKLAGATVRIEK
jgi:hypothetical protein